jgi:hypothetical protein
LTDTLQAQAVETDFLWVRRNGDDNLRLRLGLGLGLGLRLGLQSFCWREGLDGLRAAASAPHDVDKQGKRIAPLLREQPAHEYADDVVPYTQGLRC